MFLCLFGTQSYLATHPTWLTWCALQIYQQLRFAVLQNSTPTSATSLSYQIRVVWGNIKSEQCSFLLVISDSCKLSLNSRVVHSTNSLRFQREVEKQMWNWKLPTWGDVYESGYKTHCLALSSRSHNLSEIQAIMGHSCCQGRKCTWGMQ